MRGRFITFEGGEGAGKSTQIASLAERLRGEGLTVVVTREPGGSPQAEALRHVLLSGLAETLGPDAEALLFAAARHDHVRTVIAPALERGDWVLCDRFIDSTRVYQGRLGQVDPRFIAALERLSIGATKPDLTLVLDLDPETGLARAAARRGQAAADRFEREGLAFHQALRQAFRAIAAEEPERCALIDADGDLAVVAGRIWETVARRLPAARGHAA